VTSEFPGLIVFDCDFQENHNCRKIYRLANRNWYFS